MGFSAVYVHIPFCLQKCNYCDFLSYPGKLRAEVAEQYFSGLEREFILWQKKMGKNIFTQGENITVYFGGGTPSLMPVDLVAEIIAMVRQAAVSCRSTVGEITIEANPGTIDKTYLAALQKAGVTRISLGAQSFDDKDLAAMGRLHNASDIKGAVVFCMAAGFDNISLDLIANLPGQTVEKWLSNLEQAVALDPAHISCYGLHLSENTPWGRKQAAGQLLLPDEEVEIAMWQRGRTYLQQMGYEQYEISNFAKPGSVCRHNLNYWRRENYLGLGLGAASCYENHRWSNVETLENYAAMLQAEQLPVAFGEELTDAVVLAEGVVLGLRCMEGILFDQLEEKYGTNIRSL